MSGTSPKNGAGKNGAGRSDAPADADDRDDAATSTSPAAPPVAAAGGERGERGEPDARNARDAGKPRGERANASRLEVELEVSRSRSMGWTIFGLLFGGLLIWKLGTVGVWVGFVLVAMGVYHAWNLARTFLYPPGTIAVSDREVTLPRGPCAPRPVVVKPSEVTAVYFLRRSVPWNHAAPVLVVELGPKAMLFPRDWFVSEADQRRIVHALLRDKPDAGEAKAAADDKST